MDRLSGAALGIALVLLPARAGAQLHFDVGGETGAMKRFLAERPSPGAPDAGVGPVFELHGHLAVLPLFRAGIYLTHDISPVAGGIGARQITSAGLRFKLTPPLLRKRWRSWVFAGVGYAGAFAPGYELASVATNVAASGGSYFEVPLGVGVSYKVRRPIDLTLELGSRLGFGFTGSLYGEDGGRAAHGSTGADRVPPAGRDLLALYLSIGVSLDL